MRISGGVDFHQRMTTGRSILLAAWVCAALASYTPGALAQGQQDGEALITAGNESLEAGNFKAAAQQFSRAMRSDTLSNAQIAKALYLRGVALKNGGQPAQAIADLDSALWLQGLSSKDLARAYLTRGEAYQAVGMGDLANADLRRAREVDPDAATVVAARSAAPADAEVGAFTTQVETASEERASRARSGRLRALLPGFPNAGDEQPARAPSPPREEEQPRPVPEFRTSIMPEERRAPPPPASRAAPAPQAAPAAPPTQWNTSVSAGDQEEKSSEGGARGTVSNFFSGLWGGDKEDEAAPPQQQPVNQDWSQSTRVASAEPSRAPAPSAAPAPAASSGGSGSYRIQLASLRTEEEAQAAWQQLSARHGALLSGQQHQIEKTSVGNLGTFYRIQIGPFADKAQSAQLCKSLQSSGVDCFLVAR